MRGRVTWFAALVCGALAPWAGPAPAATSQPIRVGPLGPLSGRFAQAEDARGPSRLDEFGNPIQNLYILKVEKVGGKTQNGVIHTYPPVSQFWAHKPKEVPKEPSDSRDSPPVKP